MTFIYKDIYNKRCEKSRRLEFRETNRNINIGAG